MLNLNEDMNLKMQYSIIINESNTDNTHFFNSKVESKHLSLPVIAIRKGSKSNDSHEKTTVDIEKIKKSIKKESNFMESMINFDISNSSLPNPSYLCSIKVIISFKICRIGLLKNF